MKKMKLKNSDNYDDLPYRFGVGLMLLNKENKMAMSNIIWISHKKKKILPINHSILIVSKNFKIHK